MRFPVKKYDKGLLTEYAHLTLAFQEASQTLGPVGVHSPAETN